MIVDDYDKGLRCPRDNRVNLVDEAHAYIK